MSDWPRRGGWHAGPVSKREHLRGAGDRDDAARVPRLDAEPRSAHLDGTLRIYAEHYNGRRPHRVIGLASQVATAGEPIPVNPGDVRRRSLPGGLVHEYHGAAA
jgi:hypothetical protein